MTQARRPAPPEYLTTAQAAAMLGVHPQTLRANRGRAYPVARRVGPSSHRRYPVADLERYLARTGDR